MFKCSVWWDKLRERDHLENLVVVERKISSGIFKNKLDGMP
jgi:hypothetical protein